MHTLIGIAFSHFVEKARWVLDRYHQPYEDLRYLPTLHFPRALVATRGRGQSDRVSTRFSTPILVTDRGEVIGDSSRIVRYASDRWGGGKLYADEEAAVLEQRFHDVLAPATRRIGYFFCLDNPAAMDVLVSNVGPAQRALWKVASPVASRIVRDRLGVSEERVERAITRTREELEQVSERLADGRPYLLGDRFSAADIAFACAAAPALMVQPEEGYKSRLPTPDLMAARVQAMREELRALPAGQLALRLFRDERR